MAMKTTNKIPNCPPLRFPEFSDEWNPTSLGEICKVSTGSMNTQDKVEDGKYPFFVRSSRIERASHYTFDGIAILTPGDGAIGQIFHYSEGKIAVHQRVYMLTEMQCIPKYLFHFFSAKFFERVSRMSAKNTVDSVRMSMITDMPISLPSLAEQERIAGFLSLIDERIEFQRQIIEERKNQKKALLARLFDQSLRFPSFSDEWKQTILGEICTIAPQIAVNNPKVENILSVRLHGKGITRTTTNTLKLGATQYYLRSAGQLIYGKQNFHNGAIALISSEYDGGITSKDIPSFIINENKADARFLLIYLLREEYYKGAEIYTTGTGSKRLKEISFFSLPISLPSLPEQERIANFLSLIDERIELEEALLRQYELQKRYLLQQMFV